MRSVYNYALVVACNYYMYAWAQEENPIPLGIQDSQSNLHFDASNESKSFSLLSSLSWLIKSILFWGK